MCGMGECVACEGACCCFGISDTARRVILLNMGKKNKKKKYKKSCY